MSWWTRGCEKALLGWYMGSSILAAIFLMGLLSHFLDSAITNSVRGQLDMLVVSVAWTVITVSGAIILPLWGITGLCQASRLSNSKLVMTVMTTGLGIMMAIFGFHALLLTIGFFGLRFSYLNLLPDIFLSEMFPIIAACLLFCIYSGIAWSVKIFRKGGGKERITGLTKFE